MFSLLARGLGSSSAAIVGGLVAGLVLAGEDRCEQSSDLLIVISLFFSRSGHQVPAWGSEELLNMAANIEGHPDKYVALCFSWVYSTSFIILFVTYC